MKHDLQHYYSTVVAEGLYSNEKNLEFNLSMVFNEINFENARFLEIGGGRGLHSFYAACRGALEVICLEPEAAGSTSGVVEKVRRISSLMGVKKVDLEPATFQDFEPRDKLFDIILLHDSINHLDEDACINLLNNDSSKTAYKNLFHKLASMADTGASLIICDCSRFNFFASLGIRNPLTPNIEWHKHQSPSVWISMLIEAGFGRPRTKWISFNRFGSLGQLITGNKFASYFLKSYFCLAMKKL